MRVNEFLSRNTVSPAVPDLIQPAKVNPLHSAIGNHFREILDEDSSVKSAVRASPYVDQLISVIHKDLALPHDQAWQQMPTISWAAVKNNAPNFVIISGTKGTAAIKWNGGTYTVITSGADGINTQSSSSINTLGADIKAAIGKMSGFWVNPDTYYPAKNNGALRDWHTADSVNRKTAVDQTREKRKQLQRTTNTSIYNPTGGKYENMEILTRKLFPLYKKYVEHALADVKGAIGIAIKNDALDRVGKKINNAKTLLVTLEWLENNQKANISDMPLIIKNAVMSAINMAAAYYYPDETPSTIVRGSGLRHGGGAALVGGSDHIISDIVSGDSAKLAAVMNFIKQELVHG